MPFEVAEVDVSDAHGWARALAPRHRVARDLLDAFDAQVAAAGAAASVGGALPMKVFGALRRLLTGAAAMHHPRHAAEVAAIAAALGLDRRRLLFANLAYDLAAAAPLGMIAPPGCSTFVVSGSGAVTLHARNLDWHFPGTLLQDHPVVWRVRGAPCGRYASVGWAGLTGVLTGLAPGRFSVSVNFVKKRGDGFGRLLARAGAGATPVAWAVRDALDRCESFEAAVQRLATVRLLAPALLTIAGTRDGEACVIERAPLRAAIRRCQAGAVCVTNHYASDRLRGRSVDYDAGDTLVRLRAVEAGIARPPSDPAAALAALDGAVRAHTQHQAVMRAADGLLWVRVPGGERTSVALS